MSLKLMEASLPLLRNRFMKVVTKGLKGSVEHDIALYRARMLFDQTVLGGKYARSTLCVDSFLSLNPNTDEEKIQSIAQIAGTLEMIQSFYLIADDIMDGAETRRGKTCWYKKPDIGMSAINDAFLLDSYIEDLVKEIIPSHPNVDRLCEAYRRSKKKTLIGQLLDTAAERNIDYFTWDRYETLVEYKTSHYTYFNPLEIALLLSDILGNHSVVKQLAYQIGFLFQAQDDVLDVFGHPTVTGKIGTDIADGKCTYVTVRAIEKLRKSNSHDAEKIFIENFGKSDERCVNKVKEILSQLRIKDEFNVFEKRFSEKILENLNLLPSELSPLRSVLQLAIGNIVKRNK